MNHQVKTLTSGIVLPDGKTYWAANTTVTLTDAQYAQLPLTIFSRGYLADLGPVATALSAKDYGATGNGITDDTVALQTWLNAVASTGMGQGFLSPGKYIVDPGVGLLFPSNIEIFGAGVASIISIANQKNTTGNILKTTNCFNLVLRDFALDGNQANQSGVADGGSPAGGVPPGITNNYGIFFDSCTSSRIERVWAFNWAGVAIQAYNCEDCSVTNCVTYNNFFHGIEVERCRGCHFVGNDSYGNGRHGLFLSPGEVGGTGSNNNQIVSNTFHNNAQYGLAIGTDAQGLSDYKSFANTVVGNAIYNNGHYGLDIYKQDGMVVANNVISGNGYHGLHVNQSSNNTITGNLIQNCTQTTANAWDYVCVEGATATPSHPSKFNRITGNTILTGGANPPRYVINEGNGDGPNYFHNNTVVQGLAPGTAQYNITHAASERPTAPGVQQVTGGQTLPTGSAGIDNAFNILRLVSGLANSQVQVVSNGTGDIQFWVNGTEICRYSNGGAFQHRGSLLSFYNAPPIAKPAITGSRGANAAVTSLLSQLVSLGLITDSTTA